MPNLFFQKNLVTYILSKGNNCNNKSLDEMYNCTTTSIIHIHLLFPIGESIPVTKTSLDQVTNCTPWKIHSGEDYKRHVLFCGTEVIQTTSGGSAPVTAVVLQTGWCIASFVYEYRRAPCSLTKNYFLSQKS